MEHSKPQKLRFNKYILLLLLGVQFCAPSIMHSQSNLVVNADVELYDTCPDNVGQITRAIGWWMYSVSSADYFNVCSNNPIATIPSVWGYQIPNSGNGYLHADILTASKPRNFLHDWGNILGYQQSREPLSGTFVKKLRPVPHKIEFFISATIADETALFTNAFDMLLMHEQDSVFIPVSPYISLSDVIPIYTGDTVIRDTMHWIKLSACFLPKGGERYFSIGAFRDTSLIKLEFGSNSSELLYAAQYYFDSFKVTECTDCCIDAFPFDDAITLVNNPSSTANPAQFTVVLHGQTTATLLLYDSAGRLVKRVLFSDLLTNYTLDAMLAQGMYHYTFESSNGTTSNGKLLVVE